MKKIIISITSAIIIGGLLALYFFNKSFQNGNNNSEELRMAQAFQIGAFTKYDNAYNLANQSNGIVIRDNDIYRVYIALLSDKKAINIIKGYYESKGINYYLKNILVSSSFIKEIGIYEKMIIKNNASTYDVINKDVLLLYQNQI